MNTYLRFLNVGEARSVYKSQLKHHFPADEVKPWKSISRMWADGCYFAVGVFEDPDVDAVSGSSGKAPGQPAISTKNDLSQLRGYAFFVESPDCDACLLDYYAILPEYRDAGLGGRTLQQLAELVRDRGKYILLETEDIDFAKTEEQIVERTRRDRFYTRNGCVKTDVKGSVFGVKYAVWALGLSGLPEHSGANELSSASGFARLSDDDLTKVCSDIGTLYRLMVPGEKFHLFVKIKRAPEKRDP